MRERPRYVKLLAVSLVLMVTAAAAYAVLLRPLHELIIGSGALVLGVWGVRAILLGTALAVVTLVDLVLQNCSLVTIAVPTVLCRTDQRRGHIGRGLDHGLSAAEIGELITHVAFHAGRPVAVDPNQVARQVFDARRT
jgi:hypothetical protein